MLSLPLVVVVCFFSGGYLPSLVPGDTRVHSTHMYRKKVRFFLVQEIHHLRP
jgi:hypothetical protein